MVKRYRALKDWKAANRAYWRHRMSFQHEPHGCTWCPAFERDIDYFWTRAGWMARWLWWWV